MSAEDEAQERQRRRHAIERRIARLDTAIEQWHARDASRVASKRRRQDLAAPALSLAECMSLRLQLLEELAQLDPA